MGEIVARRLALMVLTMLIVSMAIFLISEVVPIDLAGNVLGQFATTESLNAFREQNGLNCPKVMRYFIWLAGDTWVDSARNVLGAGAVPADCNPPKLARLGVLRATWAIRSRMALP